jgi:hypothetical protein
VLNLRGKDNLENTGVDGKILLNNVFSRHRLRRSGLDYCDPG